MLQEPSHGSHHPALLLPPASRRPTGPSWGLPDIAPAFPGGSPRTARAGSEVRLRGHRSCGRHYRGEQGRPAAQLPHPPVCVTCGFPPWRCRGRRALSTGSSPGGEGGPAGLPLARVEDAEPPPAPARSLRPLGAPLCCRCHPATEGCRFPQQRLPGKNAFITYSRKEELLILL